MKKIRIKETTLMFYSVFGFVNPVGAIWLLSFLILNALHRIEIIEG